jgi:hypothetical protein
VQGVEEGGLYDYAFSEDEEEAELSTTCVIEQCIMWGGEERLRVRMVLQTFGAENCHH